MTLSSIRKAIIGTMEEGNLLVDFLSAYRTRDHMHGSKYEYEETKKYYPEGALFWFECDADGNIAGPAVFVKRVPDKSIKQSDGGFERLSKATSSKPSLTELLKYDRYAQPLKESSIKPRLFQQGYT